MADPVLQFSAVTLSATDRDDRELSGVDFALNPGDCLAVRVEEERICPLLADTAIGLLDPSAGRVLLEGKDWARMAADDVSRVRSRIGRVFEEQAWVSNLDVDENITLAQRHHTRRSPEEIRDEALRWARRFGRDALLYVRPAWAPRQELLIAQWIRACLGEPRLLIFERPTRDATDEECRWFLDAMREHRQRGAGVIVLASDERLLDAALLRPTLCATVEEDRWEITG